MILGPITLFLAFYLCKIIYTDITLRMIKNREVMAVFCCCLLLFFLTNNYVAIGYILGVFIVSNVLFALGVVGGGDVKLMAAVSFAIPVKYQTDFIAAVLMLGGVLAIMIIIISKLFKRPDWKRLGVPYAVPISLSGFYYIAHTLMSL
jgi:prepilin peptidase CpaA